MVHYIGKWFTCWQTVTHPTGNWVQGRATLLNEIQALTTWVTVTYRDSLPARRCSTIQEITRRHMAWVELTICWSQVWHINHYDAFDLLPHCRWMSVVHGCPPSVIKPSLLLVSVLGTVCPNMSRPHPLCLFSEVASKLSSSGVPSHDFHRNFCRTCAVTLKSFFLLTYYTPKPPNTTVIKWWCSYLSILTDDTLRVESASGHITWYASRHAHVWFFVSDWWSSCSLRLTHLLRQCRLLHLTPA